jgi:UDP-N-acetylmuramoyl-L-alanyl-D-glutamate--2,6-diaminopimelate ligase
MMATRPMQVDNLRELLAAIDALPVKITHVTAASMDVMLTNHVGSLFLAYPGAQRDGRDYIQAAVDQGAAAVLFESGVGNFEWNADLAVPGIAVDGLKQYASAIGAHIYQHPSKTMWMVGVTGTNGKTSVAQWCSHAFAAAGRVAAVMGTIGNGLVGKLSVKDVKESSNTTADALVMQQTLRQFADSGVNTCAMEVSSHGLDQGRVSDVKFDVAVFTNLTRDHLDYHKSMAAYGEAKAQLFMHRDVKTAVVNVDDVFGREIASRIERRGVESIRFATNGGAKYANLIATNIAVTSAGLSFQVRWLGGATATHTDEAFVETEILGAFNASNLLAVIGVLIASGYSLQKSAALVSQLKPVRGRMQTVRAAKNNVNKPLVVVDYAHTPDALEKVLSTISAVVPDKGRLICVFGCGGDRDKGKRPLMGAISAKYADFSFVTSDNPRTEDAARIIDDIAVGVADAPHCLVIDRRNAIMEAIAFATVEDVVVIAGKGHEDTQIVGNTKFHFSDVEVATEALASWSMVTMTKVRT